MTLLPCQCMTLSFRFACVASTVVTCASVAQARPQAAFTEEAGARGVSYLVHDFGPFAGVQIYGTGVAFVDLDNDGDEDLVVLGRVDSIVGFYENDGTGNFTDRTAFVGLPALGPPSSITAADYDADGDLDIYVGCYLDDNLLLRNEGPFQFTEVAALCGVNDAGPTMGCAWADINHDKWLDLYVPNRSGALGDATPNRMFKNNKNGTFSSVANGLGVEMNLDPSLVSAFFDYDRDGDADLYVGNDKGTGPALWNHLFNNTNGTFTDVTTFSNTAANVDCMGIAIGDWDRNGWQDLYVTNTPPGNVLMLNNGDGTFTDTTLTAGVGSYGIGWATMFFDFDNDGWEELYVCDMLTPDRFYNYDGVWPATDLAPSLGIAEPGVSFCSAIADIDGDGDLDFAVSTIGENLRIYINHEGETRNWARFRVIGQGANHFAVGAQVDLHTGAVTQMREVFNGSNYKSQNEFTVHFGVDTATNLDEINVMWPGGDTRTLTNYAATTVWTLYPPERMGDANADGQVGPADWSVFMGCIGATTATAVTPGCEMMDFDGNGNLNCSDSQALLAIWTDAGTPPTPPASLCVACAVCPNVAPGGSFGEVNLIDINFVLFNFGAVGIPPGTMGDTDCDGDVDLSDISAVLFNFGTTVSCGP